MTGTVNHPPHYNASPSGVECITVVEHMSFNIGNAVKYLWRADEKGAPLEDLAKAAWYIEREIARRRAAPAEPAEETRLAIAPGHVIHPRVDLICRRADGRHVIATGIPAKAPVRYTPVPDQGDVRAVAAVRVEAGAPGGTVVLGPGRGSVRLTDYTGKSLVDIP